MAGPRAHALGVLLAGNLPQIPPMRATFDRAQWIRAATHAQSSLLTDWRSSLHCGHRAGR